MAPALFHAEIQVTIQSVIQRYLPSGWEVDPLKAELPIWFRRALTLKPVGNHLDIDVNVGVFADCLSSHALALMDTSLGEALRLFKVCSCHYRLVLPTWQ